MEKDEEARLGLPRMLQEAIRQSRSIGGVEDMREFMAWDWDGGKFIPLKTENVVEAIYTAWNYEFDVYEVNGQDKDLIFSGQEDNEWNSEMLRKYGIRVIDHDKQRHLQSVETGEIFYADWQRQLEGGYE